MNGETSFVPKILLCGDEAEFISRVDGQRPYKIVGHVTFSGEAGGQKFDFTQDGKILLDDKLREGKDLSNMIRGGVLTLSSLMTVANLTTDLQCI